MPRLLKSETMRLHTESELLLARRQIREWATELGFGPLDLTKILTAASELARNTLIHGQGGTMVLDSLEDGERRGLRLTFDDQGPGIEDIPQAMTDGFTTGGGMGLGLGGSKRLVSDFLITSKVNEGTHVTVTRWI